MPPKAVRDTSPAGMFSHLEQIRGAIAAHKSSLAELEDTIVPRAVAESRIDAFVDGLAERADLQASDFTAREFQQPRWWEWTQDDVLSLVALVAGDQLKARFKEQVEVEYEGASELADADMKKKRAETVEMIFQLEIEEERHVMAMEELRLPVARRGDADPRALLEA